MDRFVVEIHPFDIRSVEETLYSLENKCKSLTHLIRAKELSAALLATPAGGYS
jgi:hypothetical protein